MQDPGNYLASTVRLRAVPNYNDADTYGTITGGFEMAKAKTVSPVFSIPAFSH